MEEPSGLELSHTLLLETVGPGLEPCVDVLLHRSSLGARTDHIYIVCKQRKADENQSLNYYDRVNRNMLV